MPFWRPVPYPHPYPDPPADEGFQTIRRLGPYTIDYDYAGVNSEPEFFGEELAEGLLILRAFCFVTSDFVDSALNPMLQVVVGTSANYPVLSWNTDIDSSGGVVGKIRTESNFSDQDPLTPFVPVSALIIGTGQKLGAVIWHDTGTLEAGSADIYALVVEHD